jgi:hypothetical protein
MFWWWWKDSVNSLHSEKRIIDIVIEEYDITGIIWDVQVERTISGDKETWSTLLIKSLWDRSRLATGIILEWN